MTSCTFATERGSQSEGIDFFLTHNHRLGNLQWLWLMKLMTSSSTVINDAGMNERINRVRRTKDEASHSNFFI